MVFPLNHTIGRVLAALDETGTVKNTFVFFMSDNVAFRLGREGLDVGVNTPLRRGGVTCWEGGLRVATMARWPGQIEAGSVVSEPLWSPDLLLASARIGGVGPTPRSQIGRQRSSPGPDRRSSIASRFVLLRISEPHRPA